MAKGIQRYLMPSHMVANSNYQGSPRVFHGIVNEMSSIRNTQYLMVLRDLTVFKI